jgi:hypothetical protein
MGQRTPDAAVAVELGLVPIERTTANVDERSYEALRRNSRARPIESPRAQWQRGAASNYSDRRDPTTTVVLMPHLRADALVAVRSQALGRERDLL